MPLNLSNAVAAASKKWGVPTTILWGVWGMETDWGRNVQTSSAGAVGDFQFIPSTAATYNYPLTNKPTDAQFLQQLDSAAHYLHDLGQQHGGNWDAALRGYSGGGYGLAEVQAKAKHLPGSFGFTHPPGVLGPAIGAASSAANTASSIGSGVASVADLLTSTQFWIRLGEAIAGIILIAMGLRSMTGTTTGPGGVVQAAARVARA